MESLIQDLLIYSRTVYTAADVPAAEANLNEALDRAIVVVETRITETGATITRDRLPNVRADTAQLVHVFQNLLSNALKYRSPDNRPEIRIRAEREQDKWIISVSDNGIGFEPRQAERIFGLFKRLHRDEEYPGTGLGLAICKRIVERYRGNIWAQSEVNRGSTFFFSFPVLAE